MPRRGPIVPSGTPGSQRRKAKGKAKRKRDDEADEAPPWLAAPPEPAGPSADAEEDDDANGSFGADEALAFGTVDRAEVDALLRPELLSLSLSEWSAVSGHDILAMPDQSDKSDRLFGWLLAPLTPQRFEEEVRERRPVHVSRPHDRSYYRGWFGSDELRALLRAPGLTYTDEVDVTRYEGGRRTTLNGEGVAPAEEVLAQQARGCSVRLSWPQRHSTKLWGLLAALEEWFGCGAGCNAYWTPAGTQGFAPHYDDVDVFVLQVEGEKRWTLHPPRSEEELLPRASSVDFEQASLGPPLAELTLSPGDLLYLPRGTVHQARTPPGGPASLHLTVSVSRRHTWRDLLELGLMGALETAAASNVAFRRALPRQHLSYVGAMHSDSTDPRRAEFAQQAHALLSQVLASLPVDAVADQFAVQNWMHERMPPLAPPDDARRLAHGKPNLDARVRMRSRSVARLAVEGELAVLYHHAGNTRVYREIDEPQHIDFDLDAAPALDVLLASYPKYVSVRKLPLETDAQKLDVVAALAEANLLLVREPAKE